jgi:response regulator RpfG family c-di-GMP phosphodiesterase
LDLLLQARLIGADSRQAVLDQVEQSGERSEEAVLELGLMTEADLLKAMAGIYKTNFVTTDKLSKANIPRSTLEMVPRRVAEALQVLPVLFDPDANALSVVSADPDNAELLREVKLVSGARDVRAFFARPASIRAGILKYHGGNLRAFDDLERSNAARWVTGMMDNRGGVVASQAPESDPFQRFGGRPAARSEGSQAGPPPAPPQAAAPPPASQPRVNLTPPPPPPVPNTKAAQAPPPPAAPVPAPVPAAPAQPQIRPSAAPYSHDSFSELLSVLVSLLENSRQELRGHSAMVARLIRRAAERINLDKESLQACIIAAYVHDLGKMGQFHLTALNCSEYEGHKVAAQKAHDTPLRLLEAVRLTEKVKEAVFHMYERFDGKGFPDGLAGKEIPLAARLLALADTYADLTNNSRNPYRKQLQPQEACAVLAKYRETIFDPHLVDLFRSIMMGEDIRAKLLSNRLSAIVIDSDPEETTVLELRMIEQGFEVKTARSIEQARRMLQDHEFNIVVSEVEMPDGDGLALLADARQARWGRDLNWVVHTRQQGRSVAQRAFDLKCLDFVSKPVSTDVFVAKLRALVDRRQTIQGNAKPAAGVSGSLTEMGLPDLVQVLFHGRKTGNLKIKSGSDTGEIHFLNGAIAQAIYGKAKGPDAFYAMCKLTDGEFALDPTFKPGEVLIKESAEALLLEGMRRMDEGL